MFCGAMMTTFGGVPVSRRGIYPSRLLDIRVSQCAKVQFIMVARIALLPLLCLEDSGCLMPELPGGFKKSTGLFSFRSCPGMGGVAACEIKKYRPKRSQEQGRLFEGFHGWGKGGNAGLFYPPAEVGVRGG
jgi:hypothetical protein